MLPNAYPYDYYKVELAWQNFMKGREIDQDLDPAVLRSWKRCRDYGLNPALIPQIPVLSSQKLKERQSEWSLLIAIARSVLEDLYQFMGEKNVLLLLTDNELCVLDILGDEQLEKALKLRGIGLGSMLSEQYAGTNALALAQSEGIASQVLGAEHYFQALHFFSSVAAPIHTQTGENAGMLAAFSWVKEGHPHTLAAVMAAAKSIEAQIKVESVSMESYHSLSKLDIALTTVDKGVIFLSPEGVVTHMNSLAGELLGISHLAAMGHRLSDLIEIPETLRRAMENESLIKDTELSFKRGRNRIDCLVSGKPFYEGNTLLGYVLLLDRSASIRELVTRMSGAHAHFTFDDIIGQDPKMKQVIRYAKTIAKSDVTVLLVGESGTGKEMFAQAIHNASRRANGPFVAINCAALPREVIAIELFGYVDAYLPGMPRGRPGKFELASGGTLFLDNIAHMPLEMQLSLLRLIDHKEVVRLGGTEVIPVDVRIIAASTLDLNELVQRKQLREELYYRLRAFTIHIPPLRERGNDILLLIAYIMERLNKRLGKSVKIAPEALALLQSYSWPGNVRELENVLEQAVYKAQGDELTPDLLPKELRCATLGKDDYGIMTMRDAEREAIIRAGRALRGNVTKMAQVLGISRTTLWRRMREFGISPQTFK